MFNKIKKIIFYLIGTGFLLSNLSNIYKQAGILLSAKGKNKEIYEEIVEMERENREMNRQIEYATSSAFINRQARESFGLGTEDDYWLEIPEEEGEIDLFPETNMDQTRAKYEEWLDLFR
ncbi:hypothetical protein KJ909_01240 [Patescibacteria group bacterium]|nr:hypothetical protein [Patescibacteria group bacterium]